LELTGLSGSQPNCIILSSAVASHRGDFPTCLSLGNSPRREMVKEHQFCHVPSILILFLIGALAETWMTVGSSQDDLLWA